VAICTLVGDTRRQTTHRPASLPSHQRAVTRPKISASKLQEIEERLLDEALDHHPHREAALDAALDDMAALSAELRQSRRRPLLLRSTSNLNRIEDMLLEAIVRTHPHRERALDRILGDMCCAHDGLAASVSADQRAQIDFDMSIDNDFDGMA